MQAVEKSPSAVDLARRWVVDYFNSHDQGAAREFVTPGYALDIGEYRFAGRDEQWLPAVQQQMDTYPGLGMTVHRVVASETRAAVLFTQHGASGGTGGRMTCWSGVAIYRAEGGKLVGCVAQEDYLTRQRQLKSGTPDTIEAPAPAPWDTAVEAPDPQAESVVREWLKASWPAPAGVRCDDEHIIGTQLAFAVDSGEITELFSSGSDVVFHVRQVGRYLGGLDKVEPSERACVLHCNGIVRVEAGQVVSGRVIRDRAGLVASLRKPA